MEPFPFGLNCTGCILLVHLLLNAVLLFFCFLSFLALADLAILLIGLHLCIDGLLLVFVFFNLETDGFGLLFDSGFLFIGFLLDVFKSLLEGLAALLQMLSYRAVNSTLCFQFFPELRNFLLQHSLFLLVLTVQTVLLAS